MKNKIHFIIKVISITIILSLGNAHATPPVVVTCTDKQALATGMLTMGSDCYDKHGANKKDCNEYYYQAYAKMANGSYEPSWCGQSDQVKSDVVSGSLSAYCMCVSSNEKNSNGKYKCDVYDANYHGGGAVTQCQKSSDDTCTAYDIEKDTDKKACQ